MNDIALICFFKSRYLIQYPAIVGFCVLLTLRKGKPLHRLLWRFSGKLSQKSFDLPLKSGQNYLLLSLIAACAAARRAIGTRKGEQDT